MGWTTEESVKNYSKEFQNKIINSNQSSGQTNTKNSSYYIRDNNGKIIGYVNKNGDRTEFYDNGANTTWNKDGKVISINYSDDAKALGERYSYDENGNLVNKKIIDKDGSVTTKNIKTGAYITKDSNGILLNIKMKMVIELSIITMELIQLIIKMEK